MRRKRGAKFMFKKLSLIFGAATMLALTPVSAAQGPKGDEPVAVPRSIKQGIDFVYVDPELSTVARRRQRPQNWLARLFDFGSNRRDGPNPLFYELGGQSEDVGCQSVLNPPIAAVRNGDRETARAQMADLIRVLEEMPLPEKEFTSPVPWLHSAVGCQVCKS